MPASHCFSRLRLHVQPSEDASLPSRNLTLASTFTLTRIAYSYTDGGDGGGVLRTDVVLGSSCIAAANTSAAFNGAVALTAATDGPVTCALLVRPDSTGATLQAFYFADVAARMGELEWAGMLHRSCC